MVARIGKRCWILAATVCTLWSSVALAEPFHEDPPSDTTNAEPPIERWYGWQTLSVDAIPAGLFVGALVTSDDAQATFWATGALTFALAAPVVHVVHDRPLAGLGSFGLRAALPVLGMAIGWSLNPPNPSPDLPGAPQEETDPSLPLIVGGLLGAASASALDAGLLAYEAPSQTAPNHEAVHVSPLGVTFRVAPRGGTIAVLGVF